MNVAFKVIVRLGHIQIVLDVVGNCTRAFFSRDQELYDVGKSLELDPTSLGSYNNPGSSIIRRVRGGVATCTITQACTSAKWAYCKLWTDPMTFPRCTQDGT